MVEDLMRMKPALIAALVALVALGGCEPKPPKPKTEVERQALAEKHASIPQPVIGRRPERPARD